MLKLWEALGYEALLESAFETLESVKLHRPTCTICYTGISHMLANQKKMTGQVALQFLSLCSWFSSFTSLV